MPTVSLMVNGKKVSAEVEGRTLLAHLLRNQLGLTGTHIGCDTTQCGCCTVHLDGMSVKSCTVLALACEGVEVTTIEGLSASNELHPMQAAFREHHALQCGFCTTGMVMAAVTLAGAASEELGEAEIRRGLEGNICRCTGYHNIVKAVAAGSRTMALLKRKS